MAYNIRYGIKYKYALNQVVILNACVYKKAYIDKFNEFAVISCLRTRNTCGVLGPAYEITFNNGDGTWLVNEEEISLLHKET